MPQVASDATTAAYMPAPPTPPRAASNSDGAPDLPFNSLLDDGTQAAAAPPPQAPPTPADATANPAQPNSTQPPANPNGRKAAQTSGNTTVINATDGGKAVQTTSNTKVINAGGVDATAIKPKAAGNTKAKPDAKIAAQAKADDTSKPATDGKAADAPAPITLTADPVPTAGNTKATNAINVAGVDATPTRSKAAGNTKAKPDAKVPVQAKADDTFKPATDGKVAGDSKPADAPASVASTANPPNNPVQTVTPVVVAATVPTPGMVTPPATGRRSQGASVTTQSAIVAADAPKPKAADLTAAQEGTDKPATAHPDDDVSTATPHAPARTTPPAITDEATAPKPAGDAVQQASPTPPSPDVSPVPANPTAPAAPAAQATLAAPAAAVPIAGVAIEIASMAQAGKNHFEIRLDPPELGRIEVRLDVDRDGHATTRLIADRSDTLDLLRRDATGLERALQDAGLKTADNGLQFSLRDQTMGREQSTTPTPSAAQIVVRDDTLPISDLTQRNYSRLVALRGGIDIRV